MVTSDEHAVAVVANVTCSERRVPATRSPAWVEVNAVGGSGLCLHSQLWSAAVLVQRGPRGVEQVALKDQLATPRWRAPLRRTAKTVGLIGGGVGFAGFFVNYFGPMTFSLSDSGSKWMDLIPVCFGVAGLLLLVPRTKVLLAMLASTTAAIGLGIAIGPRILATLTVGGPPRFSYGEGFAMMFVGGGLLVAAWIVVGALLTQAAKDPPPTESGPVGA